MGEKKPTRNAKKQPHTKRQPEQARTPPSEWQKCASQKIDEALKLLLSKKLQPENLMKAAKALKGVWLTPEFQKTLPPNLRQWDKIGDFTLNKLIESAEELAGKYLNENRKAKLDKDYREGRYRETIATLEEVYRDCKNPRRKERKAYMEPVVNAVGNGNPPWVVILAVLALAIIALTCVLFKKLDKTSAPNMKVKEIMSQSNAQERATEKERDFLELIRLLAAASDKTDEYLKS